MTDLTLLQDSEKKAMLAKLVEIRKSGKVPVYSAVVFFETATGMFESSQTQGLLTRQECQAWIDSHVSIDGSPHLIWAETRTFQEEAVVSE